MPPPTTDPTNDNTTNPPPTDPTLDPPPTEPEHTIQSTSYDVYHDSTGSIPKCTKADLYTTGQYVHTQLQPTFILTELTITGVNKNRYAFYDGSLSVSQNGQTTFPYKTSYTSTSEVWTDGSSYEIQNRLMVDNVSYKNIYINNNIESPVVNNYSYQIFYPTIAQNDSSTYHYCKARYYYSDGSSYLSALKQTRTPLTNATTITGISKKQYKYSKVGGGDVVEVDKYNQQQSIFPYIDSDGSFYALIPGGTISEFWIDGTSYKITSRLMFDEESYKHININNGVETPVGTISYSIWYNAFYREWDTCHAVETFPDGSSFKKPTKQQQIAATPLTTITGVSRPRVSYRKLNSTTLLATQINSWDGSVKDKFPYVTHLSYGVNPSRTIENWSDGKTYTLNT